MEPIINFEAELAVIGGIFIDSGTDFALYAIETCKPDDFSTPLHKEAWIAIQKLSSKSRPVDLLSVKDALEALGFDDALPYLGQCSRNTPSQAGLKTYADKVRQYGQLRQAAGALNNALSFLHDRSQEPADRINQALSELNCIGADETDQQILNLNEHQAALLAHLDAINEQGASITGLSTGFENVDTMTGGLRNGDLIIVAARPSMGKTTLVLNMLENIAITGIAPQPALFFSLEMPAQQILQKTYASLGSVPLANILNANALRNTKEAAQLSTAVEQVQHSRLLIDDKGGQHITQIQSRAKRIAMRYGRPAVIVVDYLQLIRAEGESQTIRIGNVSAGLKNLAKQMGCPVIALSQLNRNLTGKPALMNLRDSGSIEQDADMVIFLHDEDYEGQRNERSLTEIIFAKNRMGRTGSTFLQPELHLSRFTDTERLPEPKAEQSGRAYRGRFDE